jgi:hypothetical protein
MEKAGGFLLMRRYFPLPSVTSRASSWARLVLESERFYACIFRDGKKRLVPKDNIAHVEICKNCPEHRSADASSSSKALRSVEPSARASFGPYSSTFDASSPSAAGSLPHLWRSL